MNTESESNVQFYNRLSELRQLALGREAANAGLSSPKDLRSYVVAPATDVLFAYIPKEGQKKECPHSKASTSRAAVPQVKSSMVSRQRHNQAGKS